MRIGFGCDIHAFGGNSPLILAGVTIPFKYGLIAHSDGDVILHALIDALLGSIAMGDIGKLFPNTDQNIKGINSRNLLRKSWKLVQAKKFHIGNIDISVIVQEPKILPYISQMCINIALDLDCNPDQINIKATSAEQLGFIGRSEGIVCNAIVLLFNF